MRKNLLIAVMVFLIVLAGCTGVVGIIVEEGIKQKAQELLDQTMDIVDELETSPASYDLLREIIYVPESDASDSEVVDMVLSSSEILVYDLTTPSTLTSCSVISVEELSSRAIPWSLANKPEFVENVYAITIEGTTEDGTKTFFSIPMIEVSGKEYFWSVYIYTSKDIVITPSTEVRMYPQFLFY
ncbi:MAG: hypothetical protein PWQ80_347 [Thermotoga sp.]|nr:hypothetical protein [Thermotoga sp.]